MMNDTVEQTPASNVVLLYMMRHNRSFSRQSRPRRELSWVPYPGYSASCVPNSADDEPKETPTAGLSTAQRSHHQSPSLSIRRRAALDCGIHPAKNPHSHGILPQSPVTVSPPDGLLPQPPTGQGFRRLALPWDRSHQPKDRGILSPAVDLSTDRTLSPTAASNAQWWKWITEHPRPRANQRQAQSLPWPIRANTIQARGSSWPVSIAHTCPPSQMHILAAYEAFESPRFHSHRSTIGDPHIHSGSLVARRLDDAHARLVPRSRPALLPELPATLSGSQLGRVHQHIQAARWTGSLSSQILSSSLPLQPIFLSCTLPLAYPPWLIGLLMTTPRYGCAALFSTSFSLSSSLHTFER